MEFAVAIIAEADEIMTKVFAGLEVLTSQPDLLNTLKCNIQRIYKSTDRQKRYRTKVRLK